MNHVEDLPNWAQMSLHSIGDSLIDTTGSINSCLLVH